MKRHLLLFSLLLLITGAMFAQDAPTVTTLDVTNITHNTATGGGNVTDDGNGTVTERGICWGTNHNPTTDGSHIAASSGGTGSFSCNMGGLQPNTTYYVRAYATNSAGTAYGDEVEFITLNNFPTVTTAEVTYIQQTTATGGGDVTNAGSTAVTERGICWSTSHNPTTNGSHVAASTAGTGEFTCEMSGLQPNTTYYVRAYATNSAGAAYGGEEEFTTNQSVGMPTVTTDSVANIQQTTAKGYGNVTNTGGGTVTARGICWSTNHNPNTDGPHATASGTGTGPFNCNISGLQPNTTYYVRAYATNSAGTAYGSEIEFTTNQSVGVPTVTTDSVANIQQTTAKGYGNVTNTGGGTVTARGICWSTNHNPNTDGPHVTASGTGTGPFNCNISGLQPNTTYYVRAYATNSAGTAYGSEIEFTTNQSVGVPTVTTDSVANIQQTTAKGYGNVTNTGGGTVTARGICWSTNHNPNTDGPHATASGTGTGPFNCNMSGLQPNTTYYVRAYATNSAGTAYGSEVSFTTLQSVSVPTVTTDSVANIQQTTAKGYGNVTNTGGGTVTARGICWSTNHNPNTDGPHATASGTGTGPFNCNMSGLQPNTTYYVRAYATNSAGTAYGSEVSFTTLQSVSVPTVTTDSVANIQQTTAKGYGNVTSTGGGSVTERGICWGTSHNPTTNGSHATASGTGTGPFNCNMTGLTAGTTYYVRAYAVNSGGTAYGQEISFTTSQNVNLPTVTTTTVTNIQQTTATGGGNVTNAGGGTVTERGICWSTNHNPTTNGSHTAASSGGTGSFTCSMTGLQPNTTYYVRAYAVNSSGTAYGSEVSFQTSQSVSLPTVTTTTVTNIQQTTATGGGNVTNAGGGTVTERGICWSTNHNPTTNGSHTAASSGGTGSFTCSMTGLQPNTTYYVRAYAVNSSGTAYGSEVSFQTSQSVSLPTVTTADVTNILQTTATGGGNVTNAGGGTVNERGICWSTSHNPTTNDSHVAASGTGTGSFTCNMTGLQPNTTYYVRAYAINSAGTAYGTEKSFTTIQNVTIPTVTTAAVTNIEQTTATGGGNVTNNGGGTVTDRGVCWSTNHNPNTNGPHAAANSGGTGNFTVNITNLSAGTTYYVRAYAINSAGTAYGNEVEFTTLENLPAISAVQISNVTQTSATATANVISGVGVTERGVCWSSTSNEPTTSGSHIAASSGGTGSFSVNITNLTPGTTYHVRAYAKNSIGTAYSSTVNFTTEAITMPTVVTSQISNITTTSATGGGNVTNDGGSPVTERGICWGLNPNPNTNGSHQSNGTGTGAFTVQMSNLTPDNTYYVRAYAINSAGTAYGDNVSFVTSDLPLYEITVIADPEDGGIVEGAHIYQQGQTCTVKATENPGYTFVNWTKNGQEVTTNHSYSFEVIEAATYIAHFRAITYTVHVEANPAAGGNVSTNGGTYTYGQSCTATAAPKPGYKFENWTENGEIVSVEAEYTFDVLRDYNLVANFSTNNYLITAIANPEEGGTIEGTGEFAYNADATLRAIANEGYDFENWKEGSTVVWAEEVYSFKVTANRNLEANFKKKEFTITVLADPAVGGTVDGGGVYKWKDIATLEAKAKEGYQFTKWQDGNTDNPRVEEVTEDATYKAIFTRKEYTITTDVTPEGSGYVTVEGTCIYGDTVTLKAEAYEGYQFAKWDDDNTDNPRKVKVTSDMNFTAIFEEVSCIVDLQQIAVKEHKEGNKKYPLILVYPNPNEEVYEYQWLFSLDGENYSELKEGSYNKQYYYKGGRLKEGYYKVRISKGECSDETEPYAVRSEKLRVYPNPSHQGNNIMVEKDCEGTAQLSIYSIDGRLLHSQTVTDEQAVIDIKLPQGVYVAYLTNHDGYTKVGKLIIQ